MYPENRDVALVQQLETERAISDLITLALEIWLPRAEEAVLNAAAPPPDPAGAAQQEAQWNYLVDTVVLYGIGLIAANTMSTAYQSLTGTVLATADVVAPLLTFDMPGLPDRAQLRSRVSQVLQHRLRLNADAVDEQVQQTPALRTFVATHLGAIRNRVLDAVGRTFRRIRGIAEDSSVEDARSEAAEEFDLDEWRDVADSAGQTQATAVLNAAAVQAAQIASTNSGLDIRHKWVSILDTVTRPAHIEANGQDQPLNIEFNVGGELLQYPGDPAGSPENTSNCRCRSFMFIADASLAASADATMVMMKEEKSMAQFRSFTSVLAVIGEATDDGRIFADDIDFRFRDFPLPLMWQRQSSGGHFDSFTVGVIESAIVQGKQIVGQGYMLDTGEANEAINQVTHKVTGPSVDLADVEWEMRDDNGKTITEEDWWEDPDMKVMQTVLSAKLLGATLVSTPAFGSTSIELGEMVERGEEMVTAVVASAAGRFKTSTYPVEYFSDPGFDEPTLPHITEDGRIQGHLAAWNVCHTGIQDRCQMAPRTATDYSWFHTSPPLVTDGGQKAKVGRLTVGGGHASGRMGVAPAIAHYDETGTCFALVHVGEDEHGIWFSGVPAPGATEDQISQGLSAPLSGDWRMVGGNLELVAALAVNTPGFPIIASGATNEYDEPMSLVASLGPCSDKFNRASTTNVDVKELARQVVMELRSTQRREQEVRTLVASFDRREAARALLHEMT